MNDLNIIVVFVAGITSFFAPCNLPLIPLYLAYINKEKNKIKIILNSIAFIIGILSVFFILSMGIGIFSNIFNQYHNLIKLIGGIILILMALNQMEVIKINFLNQNKKVEIDTSNINILKAFLLGFFFSFSYSACIAPIISSIVALSITSNSPIYILYIVIYGIGFTIPFVLVILFSKTLLDYFKTKKDLFKIIYKIVPLIILTFGVYMVLSSLPKTEAPVINQNQNTTESQNTQKTIYFTDFTLKDENNNTVTLEDFKDKYVMVSFTTSWCTYCQIHTNTLKDYHNDELKVVFVMSELFNKDGTDLSLYAKERNINVLNDEDGQLFKKYAIYSYPQTIFIAPDTSIIGKLPGAFNSKEDVDKVFEHIKKMYNQ